MNKIAMWIELCTVFAIISAIFQVIVPESKLKNVYKTMCALIMLFSFFSVFSGLENTDIKAENFVSDNSVEINERAEALIVDEGENMMNNLIENRLYENGIEAKIKTEMIFTDDTLKVKSIYLYGSFSEKDKALTETMIKEYIGEECEVIFAKKNG